MPNFSGYFVSYWVVLLSTLVEVCDLLGEEQGVDGGELRTTGRSVRMFAMPYPGC